jgi:diguanylate cyclase (GGDEF)-like protein
MKRLFLIFVLVLECASTAWSTAPATLTSLRAIRGLTNARASNKLPVAFEATVGYARSYENTLFVQDGEDAIFVRPPDGIHLVAGDRVLVQGTTQASFHPIVFADKIALLHRDAPPTPVPATFDELIRAQRDCRLVTVHAIVRAADLIVSRAAPIRHAQMQLLTESGPIEASVDSDDGIAIKNLLDAEVEVTGVAAGKFDDKMQQTGVMLYVSSLANVAVIHRAGANPWSLPVTPMDHILGVYRVHDLTPRVRVHGTITYYHPGTAIVLQDGSKSLWIATHTHEPLNIGDQADAIGFPEAHERLLTLTDGEIQDTHAFKPVTPQSVTWRQLAFWSSSTPDGHQNDLVSIEGRLVTQVREASQDEYVVSSDGHLFTAIYRHPPTDSSLPPMKTISLGSRIKVTGICTSAEANTVSTGEEVPFNILLRSFDDVAVVGMPALLSIDNLTVVVGLLVAIVFGGGLRAWTIERKLRRHNAALAFVEKRRSRILEEINGSRSLAEIVEDVTSIVPFWLHGAPCWCELADGVKLGNCPPKLTGLRIVRRDIPSRTGPPHGAILIAFDSLTKPRPVEAEALSMAVGLTALAIETRCLYSDLVRRTEFDLLTDVHNRFSMEKYLDIRIEEARRNSATFGLIYIDLNDFKKVNDIYGHQVGDRYLQEVALRMKHQLRSRDMLARLGGDEFAVLLPLVYRREEVEEIATRLERCFDEPFALGMHLLRGSASIGIAIYPSDATSSDGLFSIADANMYKAKKNKREIEMEPLEISEYLICPETADK